MPICNIVDRRKNCYNINIVAVIEDSWHDNTCLDATQFSDTNDIVDYLCIKNTTIENVIKYVAQEWPNQSITLFLYDIDTNHIVDYETIIVNDGKLYAI